MPRNIQPITRIKLTRFTAFQSLDLRPSRGINVFVGANGTGKTHIMKVAYAACEAARPQARLGDKLVAVFLPSQVRIGRLVKRQRGRSQAIVQIWRGESSIRASFSTLAKSTDRVQVTQRRWQDTPTKAVYIPVKEMLANAPGFRSLYAERSVHFEEVYADVLDRAYLPLQRGPVDSQRRRILNQLAKVLEGKVSFSNEEFFLNSRQGKLEFTLVAEGLRKLGLLWLLLQNGTLLEGSILFWDEPETNLNPKLFGPVIQILLELQRMGVQVFMATHDYAILKQLDLRATEGDQVAYHALYRDADNQLACNTVHNYSNVSPNAIADAFDDLYDLDIERAINPTGDI